jgi:putative methyltransferase (TIGR04325 family)
MANLSDDDLEHVKSWTEAVDKSKGYDEKELVVSLVQQFETQLKNRPFAIAKGEETLRLQHLLIGFFLSLNNKKNISIGDFGGANGYMCDWLRFYNPEISIAYTVFEPTEISRAYNMESKKIGIQFLDINQFDKFKFDLIIISCTLQYTEKWIEVLKLSLQNAPYVLLMRVPLIDSLNHEFLIQHTTTGLYGESSSSWPVIFFSRNRFMDQINELSKIEFSGVDYEESFPFNGKKYFMNTFLLASK